MTVRSMPLPAAAAIFVILTIINGILYACVAALKAVPETEIKINADNGSRKDRKILRLLARPARVVYTQRAVLVITVFCITFFTAVPLFRVIEENISAPMIWCFLLWLVFLFIMLLFFISFGMVIPSKAAMQMPVRTLNRYCTFCMGACFVLTPLTYAAASISNACIRLGGMDPAKEEPDVTAREIISMVDEANEQGLIKENEAEMIQNIITFDEKTVREVMTPRNQITAIEGSEILAEAIYKMLEESRTRYPVYRDDPDDVIGILHFRDSIIEMREHPEHASARIEEIPDLIRKAPIVPESRSIGAILQFMRSEKIQRKSAKLGFDWDNVYGAFDKLYEEYNELKVAINHGGVEQQTEELGDLIFSAVNVSRFLGIDSEQALSKACDKYIKRFAMVEELANERGLDMKNATLEQLDSLWEEVKIKQKEK